MFCYHMYSFSVPLSGTVKTKREEGEKNTNNKTLRLHIPLAAKMHWGECLELDFDAEQMHTIPAVGTSQTRSIQSL